jgi:hypothetical protein
MKKKIFLTESEKKAIIFEREKAIIESFAKNYNKIKRLDEENFPTDDTPIDELLQRFKKFNDISDDKTALVQYIKMAELRLFEAETDDMEYHANLWQGRLKAAKEKLNGLESNSNKIDDDLLDFDIPEWALSALINGDYSGLEDDDEAKINQFVKRVSEKYGNANFMMNDIEGEDNLGFKHSNDIDNLGSNVYRLYLRPSKAEEPMNEYGLQENNGDNLNKNQSGIDQNTTLAYKIIKKITDLLKDVMYVEPDEYGMTTPELLEAFYYNFDSVDDDNGKIIGFKKGDLTSFVKRAKNYLMNHDIVVIRDNGVIDVNNSNYPEVAKLLKKLETL